MTSVDSNNINPTRPFTPPEDTDKTDSSSLPSDFPRPSVNTNTNTDTNLFNSTEHPATNVATRMHRLFLWNDPLASSLALFGSLGLLILTSYISVFRLLCATATIIIGANWAYVNLMMQGQKLFAGAEGVNPHAHIIEAGPLLSRSRVDRAADFTAQLTNVVIHEATKIALIEDNVRSVRYLLGFYLGWTFATYIPANWLIGLGLVTVFTGPKIYSQNKCMIDERLGHWQRTARVKMDNATTTTKHHAQSLYNRARSFAEQRVPAAAGKVGATFKTDVPIAKKEE